jgi:hypothetical protein
MTEIILGFYKNVQKKMINVLISTQPHIHVQNKVLAKLVQNATLMKNVILEFVNLEFAQ